MTDEDMESRLLRILLQKYRDTSEVRGVGVRQTRVRNSQFDLVSVQKKENPKMERRKFVKSLLPLATKT